MARRNNEEPTAPRRRSRAKTPEERESMLVSMAMDRIETQIEDGSASSQILTHFAKLGSSREKLEQARLVSENELLRQKVKTLEDAVDVKRLMEEALSAFKGYAGEDDEDDDYDEDYY